MRANAGYTFSGGSPPRRQIHGETFPRAALRTSPRLAPTINAMVRRPKFQAGDLLNLFLSTQALPDLVAHRTECPVCGGAYFACEVCDERI